MTPLSWGPEQYAKPQTVYICRDAAGGVLYVGCTNSPVRRFDRHSKTKAWWSEVASISAESFPDFATGRAAEHCLIRALTPRHNVSGLPRRKPA